MSRFVGVLRETLLGDPAAIESLPPRQASRLDRLLEANRLEPLVYHGLRSRGQEEKISPERLASWKMAYLLSVGRSLAFGEALREVLAVAGALRIPVRLLRGTQLGFFVYPSPELRPLLHLEVQTPPESAAELQVALRSRRFHEMEELWSDEACDKHRLPTLAREGVTVRIHKRPSVTATPWDGFSDSARNLHQPRLLTAEPLLALLCQDAARQSFCHSLLTIHDMHVVVERLQPRWEKLGQIARESNLALEIHLALTLLGDVLGTPIDGEFLKEMEERSHHGESRHKLLRKLAMTAATQHPASFRLGGFIGRLMEEARASGPLAPARGYPLAGTAYGSGAFTAL